MTELSNKKYDFYIYFFIQNYKVLKNNYQSTLKTQFNNLKELLSVKIQEFNGEILENDLKSLTIYIKKNSEKEDSGEKFENLIRACQILQEASIYINNLLDIDVKFNFKSGIVLSKELKNNKFKKLQNLEHEISEDFPFILLSERAAKSIFDEYNVYQSDISDIWYTNAVRISDSERLNNIDLEREESFQLEEFAVSEENYKILSIYGELGTGKTKLVGQLLEKKDLPVTNIYISARKKSEREFYVVEGIIEQLILIYTKQDSFDETTLEILAQSPLKEINLQNLISFSRNYFIDSDIYEPCENIEHSDFYTIIGRLKFALIDAISLVNNELDNDICIIIDNYQYLTKYCEGILLSVYNDISIPEVKYIFITQERLDSGSFKDILKEIKLQNLNQKEIHTYLKLVYPYKSISNPIVKTIHDITAGNFLCFKEYLKYLLKKELLVKTDRALKLNKIQAKTLPNNLLELSEWKISTQSNYTKEILRLISIFGSGFRYNDLEMLLHSLNFQDQEKKSIEEFCNMGLLSVHKSYYEIIIPEIFHEIYKNIPKNNRIKLHSILGEIYYKRGFAKNSFKIFYHYLRAGKIDFILDHFDIIIEHCHKELRFSAYKNILDFTYNYITDSDNNIEEDKQLLFKTKILNLVYELGDNDFLNYSTIQPENEITLLSKDENPEIEFALFKSYYCIAKSLMLNRKFKKSFNLIEKLEKFSEQDTTKVLLGEVLLLKAEYFNRINKFQELRGNLKILGKLFHDPISKLNSKVKYLKLTAKNLFRNKEYSASYELYLKVYDQQKESNNIGQIYYTMEQLAQLSLYNRDYNKSYNYYNQLLQFVTYFGNGEKQTEYQLKIALLEAYLDNTPKSIDILDTIIEDLKLEGNYSQLYQALHYKGVITRLVGFPEISEESFYNAIKASVKTDNKAWRFYSNIYHVLNFLYFNQLDKATAVLHGVKARFKAPAYISIHDICSNIVNIGYNNDVETSFENALNKLNNKLLKNTSKELQFELNMILLKMLYDNKHYLKARLISDKIMSIIPTIYDRMAIEMFNNYKTAIENKLNRKTVKRKRMSSSVKSYYKKRAQKHRRYL